MTHGDRFVQWRQDGDHVGDVQNFIILTSESVSVESFDGDVKIQILH